MGDGMRVLEAAQEVSKGCDQLSLGDPVAFTYNPLAYAWDGYKQYVNRFGSGTKRVLFVGMNPGPWGMGQTGIPFGDPVAVSELMGIEEMRVHAPEDEREGRPVHGLMSPRREVSGTRLWEGLDEVFGGLTAAFEMLFVVNHCPLLLFDDEGKNLTPPRLRKEDHDALCEVCDLHLARLIEHFEPGHVVGIGRFAEERANEVVARDGLDAQVSYLLHPSPANPHANKDGGDAWRRGLEDTLETCGILPA